MKVTTVSVLYGETRSVNWQSATIQVSLTAELETETKEQALATLEDQAKAYVNEAFDRYNERRAQKLVEKSRED